MPPPPSPPLKVSGTWDGRMCLWDLRKGALVREWYSHNERVWAVSGGQSGGRGRLLVGWRWLLAQVGCEQM